MTWDPSQYQQFQDHRTRPALDLIRGIPPIAASTIWDLGCGTGAITAMLAERWPDATVTGLDSSDAMLRAAAEHPLVDFVHGDIAEWRPDRPVDLIFSNAALHWLPDHEELFARLIGHLSDGGVLAVQMPRNHPEPSHQVLFETARAGRWSDQVGDLVRESPVATAAVYHEMLAPLVRNLEVWETVYHHALRGDDPVPEWTKGSVLRPYLDALGSDADEFVDEYATAVAAHYPQRADGITLFPFRRVFVVAQR